MRRLVQSGKVWLVATATGSGVFVLEGCDPNVRDTVLGGVEGATTTLFSTFVQAFFQSLTEPEEPLTTVKSLVDPATMIFA